MNSSSSRQNYGTLPLSPALVHELQLAFAMVETPAPRARFLNFPLADEAPAAVTSRPIRRRQAERDVAA